MTLEREKRVEIYTRFVGLAEGLRPDHLEQLRQRRGLSEKATREARLISAGPETIPKAIQELRKDFRDVDLAAVGLLKQLEPSKRNPEGGFEITAALTEDGVIIPFLDPKGHCIYLRMHKFGPAGVELEIYGQHCLRVRPDRLVITEGEYKALALIQCEIPAIALPGISSFGGKHFERLARLLQAHKIGKVVLLFDNEDKSDPALDSYKPDPLKRWDTDYWACKMARRLYKTDGIESALIARFPDKWRIDGKIDPDSALAAGCPPERLQKLIDDATIAAKHLAKLPDEGRIVVSYRLEQDKLRFSPLKEEHGIYKWAKGETKAPLSNFQFTSGRRILRASGDLERIYTLINTFGEREEIAIRPKELASPAEFKKQLLNTGNYQWSSGYVYQLEELQKRLFVLASPRVAEESDRYGRLDDGCWIFGDGMLDTEGRLYPLGGDGVVWGRSLAGRIPLEDPMCPVPQLITQEGEAPSLLEVFSPLAKTLGCPSIGLALGWALACCWSDEIFAKLGLFPILGVFGQHKSGKTTIGRWLTHGWGLPDHGQNPIKIEGSSIKGVERTLEKFASMPVWADEYRNDIHRQIKHGLRSVFDRSSSVRAEFSNDNKTRGCQVRGCLLLSGEDAPTDPALLSRLVLIRPNKQKRHPDAEVFARANAAAARLPLLIRHCLQRQQELWPDIERCVQACYDRLLPQLEDQRMAWVYAVPIGTFLALMPPLKENKRAGEAMVKLYGWLEEELQYLKLEQEEDNHLQRFWRGVGTLTRRYGPGGRSLLNRLHLKLSRDGKYLRFLFSDCYQAYYELVARRSEPMSETEHRNMLLESGYVPKTKGGSPDTASLKVGVGGNRTKSLRYWCVDLECEQVPRVVRELANYIAEVDWDRQPTEYDDFERDPNGTSEEEFAQ